MKFLSMPFLRQILSLLLVAGIQTACSQNLVPNYSFEDVNICAEFDAPCFPAAWFSVAPAYTNKIHYLDNAKLIVDGHRCVSFLYEPKQPIMDTAALGRTYLTTQLICPLQKDRQYAIRFLVCNLENKYRPIGFYFSPEPVTAPQPGALPLTPGIVFENSQTSKKSKKNDVQWYLVQGSYRAQGNEKFLAIGNFATSVLKTTIPVLYYIDALTITPVDPTLPCPDSSAILVSLYNQHQRHTPFKVNQRAPVVTNPPADTLPVLPPAPQADTLLLPDVLFAFNSARINPSFRSLLDSLVSNISRHAYSTIEITGFTDSIGTERYNQTLSLNRANAVAGYLGQQLPALKNNIITAGKGSQQPVADNHTAAGRKANRRVQVVLFKKEQL